MNEADGSPGGGAVVADPAAPSAAPTAPESPALLTADAVANIVSATIEGRLKAFENGLFANARKAGLLGKDKPADSAPTQPTTSAPTVAQAGPSLADVYARMDARIELERVISTREGKYGLTESQARRLRATLSSVPRESLASEADAYLADMGLAKVPPVTPTAPQSPAPAAAAKPNISDRGSAAPIDTRDSEGVLHSRPLEMTRHDVDDLILKHGHDKGMQMFQERVLAALGRVRIKPPRG
jgi:hypothetical protein